MLIIHPENILVHQFIKPGSCGACCDAVGAVPADFKPEIETLFGIELPSENSWIVRLCEYIPRGIFGTAERFRFTGLYAQCTAGAYFL